MQYQINRNIMSNEVLADVRHSFFEGLGFYECSPNPLFRLNLPTTGTYLLADKYGYLWLEYDEEHGEQYKESVGFGKFTDEHIKTLVSTMLNCA
jgi:hypothetical protein